MSYFLWGCRGILTLITLRTERVKNMETHFIPFPCVAVTLLVCWSSLFMHLPTIFPNLISHICISLMQATCLVEWKQRDITPSIARPQVQACRVPVRQGRDVGSVHGESAQAQRAGQLWRNHEEPASTAASFHTPYRRRTGLYGQIVLDCCGTSPLRPPSRHLVLLLFHSQVQKVNSPNNFLWNVRVK